MLKLRALRTVPVPLLLLTATMPPPMEDRALLFFSSNFSVIRTQSTSRPNLQYNIEKLPRNANILLFTIFIGDYVKRNLENGKAIVFCKTIGTATILHKNLQLYAGLSAHMYLSKQEAEEKRTNFLNWLNDPSQYPLMVTTSAFDLGVDCPNVLIIVHYQFPYSLLDYAQQTGRAGRDGSESKCMLYFVEEEQLLLERMKDQKADSSPIDDIEMMLK